MIDSLKFIFWDVQHGSAVYIKMPNNGPTAIIDLGRGLPNQREKPFSPVTHLKNRYGLKKIDLLVLTHPHRDHIEDILITKELPIDQVVMPFHLSKKDYFTNRIRTSDIPIFNAYHELSNQFSWKDKIQFGDVNLSFFCHKEAGRSRMNDHSVVTIIQYLGFKVVLMGDNESPSQKALLSNQQFLNTSSDCDLLLAPHHGRQDGYYKPMLLHLKPKLTIVSDTRPGLTTSRYRYSALTKGLEVKSGLIRKTRKVLSTNKDGLIRVSIGTYDNRPHIKIQNRCIKKK